MEYSGFVTRRPFMFRGRSEQIIDAKGRIVLPVKFREILLKKYDSSLVLTNFDNCLIAYPTEEWMEVEEKIRRRPSRNRRERNFKRFFISGATDCTVDKQGRILIPPSLKIYAELEKEIVIAGQIDHFEVWNRDMFAGNIKQGQDFLESDAEETGEVLSDLGLF